MNKAYFDEEISGVQFQVTKSYVKYGLEVIPISAISYFAVRKAKVSLLPVFILLLMGIIFIALSRIKFNVDYETMITLTMILQYSGIIALGSSIIAAIVIIIERRQRYICISSHSRHNIEVWIQGSKYKKDYEPLLKALFDTIEDNSSTNKKDVTETSD